MADYLVPMASEMRDIVVGHVETPEASTKLGAKGIGEAGLIGAMGAVWVAVNDALKPLGAKVLHQPFDDWLAITNFLGGNCTPGDDYSEISFSERPTIESWMTGKNRRNLELVVCDDGASIGHVFATENNEVVDTYTDGKRARFQGVPQEYGALRVGRTFRLW